MAEGKRNMGNPNPNPATRFKPGVSGNPGGRSKKASLSDALRNLVDVPVKHLKVKPNDTTAVRAAKTLLSKAINKKNLRSSLDFAEAANRTEGTPTQRIEHSGPDGADIGIAIEGLNDVKQSITELTQRIRDRKRDSGRT